MYYRLQLVQYKIVGTGIYLYINTSEDTTAENAIKPATGVLLLPSFNSKSNDDSSSFGDGPLAFWAAAEGTLATAGECAGEGTLATAGEGTLATAGEGTVAAAGEGTLATAVEGTLATAGEGTLATGSFQHADFADDDVNDDVDDEVDDEVDDDDRLRNE